jgi:hypothetical protein
MLKFYFVTHYFRPLKTFMKKEKDPEPDPDPDSDPDPHLCLMDPDPGGPKTWILNSGYNYKHF